MIKFSIIVLVYNTSKYLKKCLDSLVMQEGKNLEYEIIIVNDGSTDESENIILAYQKKYPKLIKYVKKENGGPSSARNARLEKVRGQYVLFVDSDDYVDTKLLTVVSKENNCDLFVYGYREVYEHTERGPQSNIFLSDKTWNIQEVLPTFFEEKAVRGYVWNKVFKADIIKNNKLQFDENVRYIEDLLFVLEYMSKCESIFFCQLALYNYLQREGSLINSSFNKNKLSSLSAYQKIMTIVSEIRPDYLPTIYYFFFELNYELSVRMKISNQAKNDYENFHMLKKNMKDSFYYFILKNVQFSYKIKALIKYYLYSVTLLKHGGKHGKN